MAQPQEASGLWKTLRCPHTCSLAFTLRASPLSRSESGGPQSSRDGVVPLPDVLKQLVDVVALNGYRPVVML